MLNRATLSIAVAVVASLTIATASQAAITTSYLGVTNNNSSLDPTDFDASSPNDVLIVLMATKKRPGGTSSIKYGTSDLIQAVTKESVGDAALNQATIYYLLNPTSGTDTITYTFASTSGNSSQQVYALYVDGVAQQAPEDTGTGQSPNATAGTMNTGPINVTAGALAVDVFSGFNFLIPGAPSLGNKQASGKTGISYGVQGSAGGLTSSWTYAIQGGKSQSNFAQGAIASFAAVPEPASMALLGLGGLAVLRRRSH